MPNPDTQGGGSFGDNLGFASAFVKYGSMLGNAIFPGRPSTLHVAAGPLLGRITSTIIPSASAADTIGYNPQTQPQYTGGDFQRYPKMPAGWTGGVSAWEAMVRRRGWTNLPAVSTPTISATPPPTSGAPAPAPTYNLPDAYGNPASRILGPANEALLFWTLAQGYLDQYLPNLRAYKVSQNPEYWRAKYPPKLDPRLMRRSMAKKAASTTPKPDKQLAEIISPGSYAITPKIKRIPAPKLSTLEASGPAVSAPAPMPTPTRSSATVPSSSSSLLSWLSSPLLGLLGRSGYQTRARPITNIVSLVDPLTRAQTGALTSPLGAFAGVPSTADCSCSKKPGKKGRKKRRTICYEGSYRETATGTRKLRRQEVPCK